MVKNSKRSDHAVDSSLAVLLKHANLASVDLLSDLVKNFVKNGLYNSEQHRHRFKDSYRVGPSRNNVHRIPLLTGRVQLLLCQIGHKMRLEEALRDPTSKLPREVASIIFSKLEFSDLRYALRTLAPRPRILTTRQAGASASANSGTISSSATSRSGATSYFGAHKAIPAASFLVLCRNTNTRSGA